MPIERRAIGALAVPHEVDLNLQSVAKVEGSWMIDGCTDSPSFAQSIFSFARLFYRAQRMLAT